MNSFIKLLLILGAAWGVYRLLDNTPAGASATSSDTKLPASLSPAVSRARAEGKKLVILITGSKWCPPCQMLEKRVISTPEWGLFASSEIQFEVYDYPTSSTYPTQEHRDLTTLKGFQGFPTIVVADGDGNVTGMRAGFGGGDASELMSWIRSH